MGGFGASWLAIGMTGVGVPLPGGVALVLPVFVVIAFFGAAVRVREWHKEQAIATYSRSDAGAQATRMAKDDRWTPAAIGALGYMISSGFRALRGRRHAV